jgi:hypothetical protein
MLTTPDSKWEPMVISCECGNEHLGSIKDRNFFNFIFIYLLTAIGLSPGGSTHLHTNDT